MSVVVVEEIQFVFRCFTDGWCSWAKYKY